MMDAELQALGQSVSNEARVLYMLLLRPGANQQGESDALNYKQIKHLLNAHKEVINLGRQINSLLKELANVGLVGFHQTSDAEHSLNGKRVILPMLATSQRQFDTLHIQNQPMRADWAPDETLFQQLARLVGLLEARYNEQEKGEFIAYWLGRPTRLFSLFQWTQKFVQHLKKSRQTHVSPSTHRVGTQLVGNTSSVAADENARKLVEKYRAKPE